MKIWWVKILTAVAGGSTGAYVVSPPLLFKSNSTMLIAVLKCLILAILFVAIVSLVPAYTQIGPSPTGTCASIGYSTSCCPRGGHCQATDGNCGCGSDCHLFSNCCSDVACPSSKLTFPFLIMPQWGGYNRLDIGITKLFLQIQGHVLM